MADGEFGEVLMRLKGSGWLSASTKQEISICERGILAQANVSFGEQSIVSLFSGGYKNTKAALTYDQIAQASVESGFFSASLVLVNRGGSDNIAIQGLGKEEADKARDLIQERIRMAGEQESRKGSSAVSVGDEIEKLADLRDKGVLTEEEFQAGKRRLLSADSAS